MITINPKPIKTVQAFEGEIVLDKEYQFEIEKEILPGESAKYSVSKITPPVTSSIEKLIKATLNTHLGKHGI